MKTEYTIKKITKKTCADILLKYHYLKDISKGFKSGFNFGLFKNDLCVGICIFTGFPVPELSKGMLGLERNDQEGLFELSRLCVIPEVQTIEYNITSWFVSRAIKLLCKTTKVRVILSYADANFHSGIIYRACNFTYYGTTDQKKDFWIEQKDGNFIKHSRGKVKGLKGEWRNRTVKHRFVYQIDKTLTVLWDKQ
jgi:hypothetical protein